MTRPLPFFWRTCVVTFGALAVLMGSSLVASSVDRHVYRARVATAVADRTLGMGAFEPFAGRSSGYRYNHNDCLILGMLVLEPRGNWVQNALSPLVPPTRPPGEAGLGVPQQPYCSGLVHALREPRENGGYYHRYLHGDWVLAGLLLTVMPFSAASTLLIGLCFTILLGVALHTGWTLLKGGSVARQRHAAYLALSVTMMTGYGLQVFGWSLSFAPSDLILFGLLLFAYRRPLLQLSEQNFVVLAALLGVLTAIFEFLIGAIPAALALLFALLAFDDPPLWVDAQSQNGRLRRAWLGAVCFTLAALLAFGSKAAAVGLVFDWDALAPAGKRLAEWVTIERWGIAPHNAKALEAYGVNASSLHSSRMASTLFAFAKMAYFSAPIGFGSRALGAAAMLTGVVLLPLLALAGVLRARPRICTRALLLFLSWSVLIGWYVLFVSHAIEHAYFMHRPLVWLTGIAAAVIAARFYGRSRSELQCEPWY